MARAITVLGGRLYLGQCPTCGKNFELHAVIGRQEGLRVGDVAVCIGCATPLILEQLPYEMRLMTTREFQGLDPETRNLLLRAQEEIRKRKAGVSVPAGPPSKG